MKLLSPRVRIVGYGNHLRLRTIGSWETQPIEALRECRHAATALEKAMYQTVGEAREAGRSWTEIGNALGVTKQTAWQRFSGEMRYPITGEEIKREGETDVAGARLRVGNRITDAPVRDGLSIVGGAADVRQPPQKLSPRTRARART